MSHPESAHAADHHHPNYVATWAVLVGLLVVSLAVAELSKMLAVVLIFGIAIVKAVIVCANFMHLRFEPGWLSFTVVFAVLVLLCFAFGVAPDIIPIEQVIAK